MDGVGRRRETLHGAATPLRFPGERREHRRSAGRFSFNGGADATDDWDEPNVTTQHKSNCHPGVTVRAWLGRAGGVGVGVCDCPARPPVQWERVGGP